MSFNKVSPLFVPFLKDPYPGANSEHRISRPMDFPEIRGWDPSKSLPFEVRSCEVAMKFDQIHSICPAFFGGRSFFPW